MERQDGLKVKSTYFAGHCRKSILLSREVVIKSLSFLGAVNSFCLLRHLAAARMRSVVMSE